MSLSLLPPVPLTFILSLMFYIKPSLILYIPCSLSLSNPPFPNPPSHSPTPTTNHPSLSYSYHSPPSLSPSLSLLIPPPSMSLIIPLHPTSLIFHSFSLTL